MYRGDCRCLQFAPCDADRAGHRYRIELAGRLARDSGRAASACFHAGRRQRRGIYRDHVDGIAGITSMTSRAADHRYRHRRPRRHRSRTEPPKVALDAGVRAICRPVLVGDPEVVARHALKPAASVRIFRSPNGSATRRQATRQCRAGSLAAVPKVAEISFGAQQRGEWSCIAGYGPGRRIQAALAGDVDAVVAAPQNQTSIALAGIEFDGYPSFVAREKPDSILTTLCLMLCFGDVKIVHCTLHVGVKEAVSLITRDRVGAMSFAGRRPRSQASWRCRAQNMRGRSQSARRRGRPVWPARRSISSSRR